MKVKEVKPRTVKEVKLKTTKLPIVSSGGLLLVSEFARHLHVDKILDERLKLKERERGYSESEFILSMSYAMIDGSSCLDDLQKLRDDKTVHELLGMEGVPHPTTMGDFFRRFHIGNIKQFERALREICENAHSLDSPKMRKMTIDTDSILFEKHGNQAGVDFCYKKFKGYNPQFAFRADTGACIFARLQRGSAYTSRGAVAILNAILKNIPDHVEIVRLRNDSGWYCKEYFEACEKCTATKIYYYVTAKHCDRLMEKIRDIPENEWKRYSKYEDVAELRYMMTGSEIERRCIVKRRRELSDKNGQLLLPFEEYVYHVVITNDEKARAAAIMKFSLKRGNMENRLKELVYGFSMDKLPSGDFMANWAYLLTIVLAYNLSVWIKNYTLPEDNKRDTIKTLRYKFIHIAGILTKGSRQLWLALKNTYTYFEEFKNCLMKIRQLKLAG